MKEIRVVGKKIAAERLEMFEDHLAEQGQDPGFRETWEALEPGYQIARLRIMRGLTQEELAEKVGTKQPSIARLESGTTEPKISFLRRLGDLEIRIVAQESQSG